MLKTIVTKGINNYLTNEAGKYVCLTELLAEIFGVLQL